MGSEEAELSHSKPMHSPRVLTAMFGKMGKQQQMMSCNAQGAEEKVLADLFLVGDVTSNLIKVLLHTPPGQKVTFKTKLLFLN